MFTRAQSLWKSIVLVVLSLAGLGFAQVSTTGRLEGVVKDEAGTLLADVTIRLAFKGTATRADPDVPKPRMTVTDAAGEFVLDHLSPGEYELITEIDPERHSAVAELFEPIRVTLTIQTAQPNIIAVTLPRRQAAPPGMRIEGFKVPVLLAIQTNINEPVVNTRDAVLGGSFDPMKITALPINGRNYLNFLTLFPGVVDGNGGDGFGSFNGTRATAQNFTLDGTTNTDTDTALPSLFEDGAVALDSIQEFRVITSNANAEYGRNSGGQVSIFVKRGTNEFHGVLYEFFAHDRLNARNFFDLDPQFLNRGLKPPSSRHQFGWNFGGPLMKDRHFFFAGYEGFRNREGLPRSPRVPTVKLCVDKMTGKPSLPFKDQCLGEQQLTSGLVGDLKSRFEESPLDPVTGLSNGGPSPLLVAIFKRAYLAPTRLINSDIGVFDTTIPFSNDTNSFIIRTDHQLIHSNRLHARYALSNGDESIVGNGLPGTGAGKDFRTQNVSFVDTHLVGDNHVNEFRFGFSRNRVKFPTAITPASIQALENKPLRKVFPGCQACPMDGPTFADLYPGIGFGADNSTINGFPYFIFPGETFANFGVDSLKFPQARALNTFQFGDTYSVTTGRHAIRAGLDIRWLQQNSITGFSLRPSFLLPDYPTLGISEPLFNDQIIGGQQNFFFTKNGGLADVDGDHIPDGPIIRGLRSTEYGFFVQNSIKLTRNLTLDAGLRYEIFGSESEANEFLSRAVNYQFIRFSTAGTLSSTFDVKPFGPEVGTTVRNDDLNNVGPRVGLAWDPFGDGKMAVRVAYGIYYDHIHGTTIFPSQLNPPGVLGYIIPPYVRDPTLDNPNSRRPTRVGEMRVKINHPLLTEVDTANKEIGNLPLPLHIIDPNFRDPYIQRWNLSVQRELDKDTLIEAGYVSSKGTRLSRARLPNLGSFIFDERVLGSIFFGGFDNFHRPNQRFATITVQESSAASSYHAFQLQVQRRMSQGLSFQVGYTVSKSIDDVSSNVKDAGTGGSIFPGNSFFDLDAEKGLSAFDVRQRLVVNYVYDLPFGPGRRLLSSVRGVGGKLLEGWSTSGVSIFQTGFPLTLMAGFDVNEDGVFNDRPILVQGQSLNDLLVPGGGRNGNTHFFKNPAGDDGRFCDYNPMNPAACGDDIVTPGRGSLFLNRRNLPPLYGGNYLCLFDPHLPLGRGVFTGPGRVTFDVALRKITGLNQLREGASIEFRAEFYNLFNHTNFADPEVVITSPQFGEITATSTSSRQIQLALKLSF